jgi:Type II secretion system (T2SS), protein E, N-terminal domain
MLSNALLSDPFAATRPRLGDLLVAKGLITTDQLGQALVEARATGLLLGQVLIKQRLVYDDELARTLAEQLDLPFVNLSLVGIQEKVRKMLPPDIGRRYAAIPVRMLPTRVQVAFADPSDPDALRVVGDYIPGVEPAVAPFSDIEMAWRSIEL